MITKYAWADGTRQSAKYYENDQQSKLPQIMLGFDTYIGNLRINALYSYKYMGMANHHDILWSPLSIINDILLHKAEMLQTVAYELYNGYNNFMYPLPAIRLRS